MSQSYRLDNVGLVNREKKLSFKFNGVTYTGYEGDTLASALIANGVHLVGRSFKYHRPRGFFGAGVDEPYAIVQMNNGLFKFVYHETSMIIPIANAIFENTINKPAQRYTITINGTILEATSAIRWRPPNITIDTINAIIIPIVKSNGIVEAILGFVFINWSDNIWVNWFTCSRDRHPTSPAILNQYDRNLNLKSIF